MFSILNSQETKHELTRRFEAVTEASDFTNHYSLTTNH